MQPSLSQFKSRRFSSIRLIFVAGNWLRLITDFATRIVLLRGIAFSGCLELYFKLADRNRVTVLHLVAGNLLGIDQCAVEAVQVFDVKPFFIANNQCMVTADKFALEAQFAVLAPANHDA
jgi:hypothetical protein